MNNDCSLTIKFKNVTGDISSKQLQSWPKVLGAFDKMTTVEMHYFEVGSHYLICQTPLSPKTMLGYWDYFG